MKKTTYVIIGLIVANFILVAAFVVVLSFTGRPRECNTSTYIGAPNTESGDSAAVEAIPYSPGDNIVIDFYGQYYKPAGYYQIPCPTDTNATIVTVNGSNPDNNIIIKINDK